MKTYTLLGHQHPDNSILQQDDRTTSAVRPVGFVQVLHRPDTDQLAAGEVKQERVTAHNKDHLNTRQINIGEIEEHRPGAIGRVLHNKNRNTLVSDDAEDGRRSGNKEEFLEGIHF